jgi:pyruvate, water dikinase
VLAWAESNGLRTPGGLVLPAEAFWEALDACDALAQARYLQGAALRLDPRHTLDIAAAIAAAMDSRAVAGLAAAAAQAAFAALAPPPLVCRSSSAMEDGHRAAFSGVFTSVLDLCSAGALAAAVAECWRSAFSPTAVRYLLRVGAEPLDLGVALLLQRQVVAPWYGVYVSSDPVTGAGEARADLTDVGPDAVVGGAVTPLRAVRRDEGWTGTDAHPELEPSLEAVHRAAACLARHLGAEVDLEFALPEPGGEPVILQCRPLTAVRGPVEATPPAETGTVLAGRPCAAGRASGMGGETVAVVDRLTTADYGVVFDHTAIVAEDDASPLSHLAILCRELGVPFVCGVEGARTALVGRWVTVDGGTGLVEIAEKAAAAAPPVDGAGDVEPTLSRLELVLRVLAEAEPGADPAAEAERILRRYGEALGAAGARVTAHPIAAADRGRLERLGTDLLGPGFPIDGILA